MPPAGDAYTLLGYEKYRSGVKTIFNSMTFTDKPIARFPRGVKKEFEEDHRIGRVINAIESKHQPISHLLNSQIGHKIQRLESDVIVKCMLMALYKNIPALPVHDALIFPQNKKEEGISIMKINERSSI